MESAGLSETWLLSKGTHIECESCAADIIYKLRLLYMICIVGVLKLPAKKQSDLGLSCLLF